MISQPVGCTCISTINVALIKYWGKRDEELNLPLNSSLSITLDSEKFHTKTKVDLLLNRKKNKHILIIDGKVENLKDHARVKKVLEEAKNYGLICPIRIETKNNFPTAAGLASSSSAFLALAASIGRLLNLSPEDTAILARKGSGSSCRSLYGGFVEWVSGKNVDGSDSIPKQIFPHEHWSDLRIIVIQVSSKPKAVSSSVGMQRSAATSELLKLKVASDMTERRINDIKAAITEKNFERFAEIVMRESNTLHALCLDTYPPIIPAYLAPTSYKIIEFVQDLNSMMKSTTYAYTFDAGPNAFVFALKPHIKLFLNHFLTMFNSVNQESNSTSNTLIKQYGLTIPFKNDKLAFESNSSCIFEEVFISKVGAGPQIF